MSKMVEAGGKAAVQVRLRTCLRSSAAKETKPISEKWVCGTLALHDLLVLFNVHDTLPWPIEQRRLQLQRGQSYALFECINVCRRASDSAKIECSTGSQLLTGYLGGPKAVHWSVSLVSLPPLSSSDQLLSTDKRIVFSSYIKQFPLSVAVFVTISGESFIHRIEVC
jgi:hypothetical protein